MKERFKNIVEELSEMDTQLRAEVVVPFLENYIGLDSEDIVIRNKGGFERAYTSDILKYREADWNGSPWSDAHGNSYYLELELSRNGIYDRLPEGVFHQLEKNSDDSNFIDFRRQQKKEQQQARLLFAPLENAFFKGEVAIEKQRKKKIVGIIGLEDDFLYRFWGLPKNFPKQYAAPLMRLLPHAKEYVGNLEITFYMLQLLLGIKVDYRSFFTPLPTSREDKGNMRLGVDFILEQEETRLLQPCLEVTLLPEKQEGIPECIGKEGLLEIAEIFYGYFLPMEYHIQTKVSVVNDNGFIVDHKKGAFLGMSTIL